MTDRQQERTIPRFVVVALGDESLIRHRCIGPTVGMRKRRAADRSDLVGGVRGGAASRRRARDEQTRDDSQPRWSAGASCIAARRTAEVVSVSLFRVRRRRTRVGVGRGGRKMLWVDGDVNVAVGGRRDVAASSLFLHAGAVPGHVPRDAAVGGRPDVGGRHRRRAQAAAVLSSPEVRLAPAPGRRCASPSCGRPARTARPAQRSARRSTPR